MKKTSLIWGILILVLFLFPVAVNMIPSGHTANPPKLMKDTTYMVYAANILEEDIVVKNPGTALLYFTHSNEAYKPVTQAKNGVIAVSHQTENITKFGEKLKAQLVFSGIETDALFINVPHTGAYRSIRPYVKEQLSKKNYDLIIDLHRDDPIKARTTIEYNEENYAKVGFVIGMEHQNFERNRAKAVLLKNEMELLVPGITRDLIMKHGPDVDGKYNQDLDPSLLVIELGGIENTEEELNRSVAVIAKAAAVVIENSAREE